MKTDNSLLYSPCPCGSGQKFKFCCWPKYRSSIYNGMSNAEIIEMIRFDKKGINDIKSPQESLKLINEACDFMYDGDMKKARELFHQARVINPTAWDAWNNEATCAWENAEVRTAYDLQKEGIEKSPIVNIYGFASMALYSLTLGLEKEANEWIEKAISDKHPFSCDTAYRVCFALALFRRHRDIIAYITESGMEDDDRLTFFKATALANLGEKQKALPLMRKATNGMFAEDAKYYVDCLEDDITPFSVYEDDWLYIPYRAFAPARWFQNALLENRDPFEPYPAIAIHAIEILVAEEKQTAKNMLQLISGRTGERMEKLRLDLEKACEIEKDWLEEDDADDEALLDEEEKKRFPMKETLPPLDDILDSDTLKDIYKALSDDMNSDEDMLFILNQENRIKKLCDESPDNVSLQFPYAKMMRRHAPENARILLQSLYDTHKESPEMAATLTEWLAEDGLTDEAFTILRAFRLPTKDTSLLLLLDWFHALEKLCTPENESRYPEDSQRTVSMFKEIHFLLKILNDTFDRYLKEENR